MRSSKVIVLLIGLGITLAILFNLMRFNAASQIAAKPCQYNLEAYAGLEPSALAQELETAGLVGEIHGAVAPFAMTVLSVREPENFFNHREFSLIAANAEVQQALADVSRHDRVCVHGLVLENPSPQPHLLIDEVTVLEAWQGLAEYPKYEYQVDLPKDLQDNDEFLGIVHAVGAGGRLLVMGYKDGILPLFVESPEFTQDLYRGDIVRVHYQIQGIPERPTHIRLNDTMAQPLEVIDSIASWHEQAKTLSGSLVKFPKSPQLKFDVYAIDVETEGLHRTFTLLNFTDMDLFTGIREKLAQIWDAHADQAERDRNSLVNRSVTITAKGVINVVSPEQANPQILINSIDDVKEGISDDASSTDSATLLQLRNHNS